jgi:hypothetical protein
MSSSTLLLDIIYYFQKNSRKQWGSIYFLQFRQVGNLKGPSQWEIGLIFLGTSCPYTCGQKGIAHRDWSWIVSNHTARMKSTELCLSSLSRGCCGPARASPPIGAGTVLRVGRSSLLSRAAGQPITHSSRCVMRSIFGVETKYWAPAKGGWHFASPCLPGR